MWSVAQEADEFVPRFTGLSHHSRGAELLNAFLTTSELDQMCFSFALLLYHGLVTSSTATEISLHVNT